MKREEKLEMLKFRIDQLRKDKMIYALESIAVSFIAELTYLLMSFLSGGVISGIVAFSILVVPLVYFIYMIIGNAQRLLKIREMEKELHHERDNAPS